MMSQFALANALKQPSRSEQTRFVILCQPRTGSSLLNTSLRQHSDIFMHREILNHIHGHKLPQEGNQRLRKALTHPKAKAVGFNVHAFQPDRKYADWRDWEPAWEALSADTTIRIIHLRRLDILAQFASWKIAQVTGMWGPQQKLAQRPQVYVDPEALRWFHEWNRSLFEWRLSDLKSHAILSITYESLCDSWNDAITECQRFLGVTVRRIEQMVAKNETRPLSNVISNWSDVADSPYRFMP